MVVDHPNGFVKKPALNLRHLFLVVGISHVYMHVRDYKYVPLLRRGQDHWKVPRAPVDFNRHIALCRRSELGNRELNHLLAEIPVGKLVVKFLRPYCQSHFAALHRNIVAHVNVYQFHQTVTVVHVINSRRDLSRDFVSGIFPGRILFKFQRVVGDNGVDLVIARRRLLHRRQDELVGSLLQETRGKINTHRFREDAGIAQPSRVGKKDLGGH